MHKGTLFNQLKLSFPPISSNMFAKMKKVPHFRSSIEDSHLYIIAQRSELSFKNFSFSEDEEILFEIHKIGSEIKLRCRLPIFQEYITTDKSKGLDFILKPNNNSRKIISPSDHFHFFSIVQIQENTESEELTKLSPEAFLFNYWNETIDANVDGDFKILLDYKVLYVGKSTEQNISDRLSGHETFQDILSLEPSLYGDLPSNEIVILLFKVRDKFSIIQDAGKVPENELANYLTNYELPSSKELSLDAEKALIQALEPSYNKVRFKSYPRIKDLVNQDFHNYVRYSLFEPIKLIYDSGSLQGSLDFFDADYVLVQET